MPKLVVTIVKCSNLSLKSQLGSFLKLSAFAPYIRIQCGDISFKTSSKYGSNPSFNETFSFYVNNVGGTPLIIHVFTKNEGLVKKADTLVGSAHMNVDLVLDVEFAQKVPLFTSDIHGLEQNFAKRATVTIRLVATMRSCQHIPDLFCNVRCKEQEIQFRAEQLPKGQGISEGVFFSYTPLCNKCLKVDKKIIKKATIEALRCNNCLMEQPFSGETCVGCDFKMFPACCLPCGRIFFSKKHGRHCYDCKKCVNDVHNHEHFVFKNKNSQTYAEYLSLKKMVDDEKNEPMFAEIDGLQKSLRWILYFFENEFFNSTITQIESTSTTIDRSAKDPIASKVFDKYPEALVPICSVIFRLKTYLTEESKGNRNVRKRLMKLCKNRILCKASFLVAMGFRWPNKMQVSFIEKPQVKTQDEESEEEESEGEEENSSDFESDDASFFGDARVDSISKTMRGMDSKDMPIVRDYLGIKATRIHGGEKYDRIHNFIDKITNFKILMSDDVKEFVGKVVENSDELFVQPENSLFMGHNVSIFQYLISIMIKLCYPDAQSLLPFQKKGQRNEKAIEMERKFFHTYEKLFRADPLISRLSEMYVLMKNFQNDDLFLKFILFKLERLNSLAEEYWDKIAYRHAVGMKELMAHALRNTQLIICDCINQNFRNIGDIFKIVDGLHVCYNRLLVKGNLKHPKDFIEKVVLRADYFDWICKKLRQERKLLGGQKGKQKVFKYMILFQSVVDHLKKVKEELQGLFMKHYGVNLVKSLSEDMERGLKEKVIMCSIMARISPEKIPIEFYNRLIPTLFDLFKFVKRVPKMIDVYDRFYNPIFISLRVNLQNQLEKWINNSIRLEDFEPVSKKIRHSKNCMNVVEFVFQPLNMVFAVDTISREARIYKKSIFRDYFVVLGHCLKKYSSVMEKKIELEVRRMYVEAGCKEDKVDFFNLRNSFSEKKKSGEGEINLKLLSMCVNNITGILQECHKIFQSRLFQEILKDSTLDIPKDEIEEEEGEEEETVADDIPEVLDMLNCVAKARDGSVHLIAECMFLEMQKQLKQILSISRNENIPIEDEITSFRDNLNEGIMLLGKILYGKVLLGVIKHLHKVFLDEISELMYKKEVLSSKKLELFSDNASKFVKSLKDFFFADGDGLDEKLLKNRTDEFDDLMVYLNLTKEKVRGLLEKEDKTSKKAYFLGKLLKLKHKVKGIDDVVDTHSPLARSDSHRAFQKKCILKVNLLKGDNLPPMDSNGFSDPFVMLKLGEQKAVKSKKIKKSLNPKWNQAFEFEVINPENEILSLKVWDYNWLASNDLIGECKVMLKDIPLGKNVTKRLPILNSDLGGTAGTLDVEFKIDF